jgi:peroxisomal 3,2-trans-enoyl-CoA isomerase
MYEELCLVLNEAAEDDNIAAAILCGEGSYFSSGADIIQQIRDVEGSDDAADDAADDADDVADNASGDTASENATASDDRISSLPAFKFMECILSFPKLLVACVNGPAVGIGVTLLLHCDVVIAHKSATFWIPFTRVALAPEFAASLVLPAVAGVQRANELLVLGRRIGSERAMDFGFVTTILDVPAGSEFMKACHEVIVKEILALPHGGETARIFATMIRLQRNASLKLKEKCREELAVIQRRVEKGDVMDAAMKLLEDRGNKSNL